MVRLPRPSRGGGIYRSDRGERRIKQQYRDYLDSIDTNLERRWIETDHGVTHLLVTGDESDPPLFVFHGGNLTNPGTLPWFLPLADSYRIYAPDTIGHPGFSAQTRLSPNEDAFARWVEELLDAFDIEQVPMIGPSYGAGIILRVATYAPERIEKAGLLVPAGLGSGSILNLMRGLVWPTYRYRLFPTQNNLDAVIEAMFTESASDLDDHTIKHLGTVLRQVKLERRMPPAATEEELAGFDAPVLVGAATDDILFPADVVLPRSRAVIPNLEVTMRLEDQQHVPGPNARDKVIRYLRTFLED